MSAKHPVIAVTGSSGAGTTTTSLARKIFAQLNLHAAEVEGDSFHRYTCPEMDMAIRKARDQGKHISYFGPGGATSACWSRPLSTMVATAKVSRGNISTL
nr:hypothetical protein GCM10025699_38730 [Microbacterium flavescens]